MQASVTIELLPVLPLLVTVPLLALGPAALFALLARWRRRRLAGGAAIAWLLYAGYEVAMQQRLLCSGECNIRIDLLLLHPLLGVLSLAALLATAWPGRSRRTSGIREG